MNIEEVRGLLTHRHSRVHNPDGGVYIRLSLEDAEAIVGLLDALVALAEPPATVEPTPEPEKAVEAKPEPVRALRGKGAKRRSR